MLLFSLNATDRLGQEVAAALDIQCAPHEERVFEDGEHKARPLIDVRGHDCYVVHSLYGEPEQSGNDKLIRLLFFAATLRDHGAARVTAVIPYLAYARKDRQTKPFDPVMTRYVASLFEAMKVDALITLETHNVTALQNAFRIPTLHLPGTDLFAPELVKPLGSENTVVVSPDPGGVKRAQLFREALETLCRRTLNSAYIEKRRSEGVVSGDLLAGDVRDATVVLVDDLISTGGTLLRAAHTCRAHGAQRIFAVAAHGLFTSGAETMLTDPVFEGVWVSNSVGIEHLSKKARLRLRVISAAPLLAETIRRCHLAQAANCRI